MTDVTVTKDVAAPAEVVWSMLSDLTRMHEWSPENDGVVWTGGATGPALGATFKGTNHHGRKKWSSAGKITTFEDGRKLAFLTSVGPIGVAIWGYEVEPTDTGCRVTETWTDQRGGLMKVLSKLATGVDDRTAHNRAGMEQTLEQLAVAAERSASS